MREYVWSLGISSVHNVDEFAWDEFPRAKVPKLPRVYMFQLAVGQCSSCVSAWALRTVKEDGKF